jgi:hypothetical protein
MTAPSKTPEARALANLRKRLAAVRRTLEEWDQRMQTVHADRTGSYRFYHRGGVPLFLHDWEGSGKYSNNGLGPRLRRIEREAAGGCAPSAEWLEATAEMRERVERLRNTPLPERDPSYAGYGLDPTTALRGGKPYRRRNVTYQPRPAEEVLAEQQTERQQKKAAREIALAALKAERKTRTAYLLDEYQREQAAD